ncbi:MULTISPECIES: squalene synthase HpnC [unclassified Variovorax]|uniref:squalene synthase HpnC n=1 Tax=unclassified Variovorax TaxID=663243 RepID=UPI00076CC385|nr:MULTISPECIES: squalene synthase HpnC [unclassified Variovorax]KWT84303.1 Phytoene synthase [Variovorax sp. WDL1]PNG52791.1 Phytoene synthase [Variovorax sp. B4]PNG55330.1 Phytoene synthase [Variovorax sp. B2]VTV09072.1 squalene synthase HpnC [Variovorax sp. WDL1]
MPSTPYPAVATAPAHYENFPVASWLCPPRLRPPIAAIYAFARTADDIADEGEADAARRLEDLRAYRAELAAAARGTAPSARWPEVFGPLAHAMRDFALPESLLADLLSAFMQDIEKTRDQAGYADRTELLDYCRRSANPIGRLLLHLYGVDDALALARSDAICSALQLINFWQDLSVDLPRGRLYLPAADLASQGLAAESLRGFRPLAPAAPPAPALALVATQVAWARELMNEGAPLVHRLHGRAGWELRFVVQGGLRILDRIEAMGFDAWSRRPTIGKTDAPLLAWRVLRMRRQSPAMTSFPR